LSTAPPLAHHAPARSKLRFWFQLGADGRAASVLIAPTAIVDDLRKAIKVELKGPLERLHGEVASSELLLGATADSRTSYKASKPVSELAPLHSTEETALIVTGVCASLALCCAPRR
jgi:hypothetical protein